MNTLTLGIEIETVNQTREVVAHAIQKVVGGTVQHVGTPFCYDPWHVIDAKGRLWKVVADASLSAPRDLQAEIVSPILRYSDIPELQEVVRSVRRAKARVDESCGIHCHLGADAFDAKSLRNLVKIVNKNEELINHALGVHPGRQASFCRGVDQAFLKRLETRRPRTLDELNRAWYGYYNASPTHYDSSRYYCLNLHNVFFRGTIEYRGINATLHAGKVKAAILFVMKLGLKAISARSASSKRREFNPATARYDMRVFLLGLGMVGDEYRTARLHLLALCEGSAAWKHGRPTRRAA